MKQDIHAYYMKQAISIAKKSVAAGGGPFGAIIVKENKILARANNRVTLDNDPTAHAEICAIRKACRRLNTFDLSRCDIYTSCEPCPMCLSAIYWAHINRIFYGCTKVDAKDIGFDDSFIYDQIDLTPDKRIIPASRVLREKALEAFRMWEEKDDKTKY